MPALALCLFAALAGCDDEAPAPGAPQRPDAPPAHPSAGAEPAVPSSAAAPAQGAAAATSASAVAGTWEGAYDAKKGSIELPPKIKDPARLKDDGKLATGPGTITLTIGEGGDLQGKSKGALGDATLAGKVEDDMMRASVYPDDPLAPLAMTGILIGKVKDGVIHAEMRVTGPDATLVRESTVELRRK